MPPRYRGCIVTGMPGGKKGDLESLRKQAEGCRRCDLWRGIDPTEYYVDWRLRVDGIVDLRGTSLLTGGPDADAEDAVWCPRWRVDHVDRIDGPFDGTYQHIEVSPGVPALLCESHWYEHGRVA